MFSQFVRSKIGNGGVMKFGVQCDSDPKGTITWVTQEKLRIVQDDNEGPSKTRDESWRML